MRERLILFAVLVAATILGALLVLPTRRGRLEEGSRLQPPGSGKDAEGGGAPSVASAGPEPEARSPKPEGPKPAAPAAPATTPPLPSYVHVDPRSRAVCGEGMLLVDGIYCPFVGHSCTKFVNEERDVCERYAPDVLCEGRLQHRRFCVDEYEYPNMAGVVPAVMVDWDEAKRACAVEDKRLCTVEEWEFACEGPQMWPYPYGLERDASACNIDRTYTLPELESFSDPWKISEEVERLDKRVPSGSMARCVSPFGVRDMTGNVDEWVLKEDGKVDDKPYKSTLKGGYWGPIRARCRPITSTHNEWFSFYQVGFRCCRDPKDGAAVEPAPPSAQIPRKHRMPEPAPRATP